MATDAPPAKVQRLQEDFSPELLRMCVPPPPPHTPFSATIHSTRRTRNKNTTLTRSALLFSRRYYDRIFPAQLMCRWLGYGSQGDDSSQLLQHREFSFTTGDDVYIRYLSYEDHLAFKKDLVSKLPHKIDIGAIFSAAPKLHKKFKLFEPLQREFIIDIDLTDYDFLDGLDLKNLATVDRCWPLMSLALRVLTTALVHDFGFEHLLWVYSGRRGIHCWVCDTAARMMSNEVRSAVADFLGPKLNAATGRLQISIPMHPTLAKAYSSELLPFFEKYILASEVNGGFGILDKESSQAQLLKMLGDDNIMERFLENWARKEESGKERWAGLEEYVKRKEPKLASVLVEIVFSYTYPRLDVNVSKGMNHLLKSPWCIHPKTGRVCVPLDREMAMTFDPATTPTLRGCAEDLDNASAKGVTITPGKEISATSLHKYEAAFEDFLKRSENTLRAERVRANKGSLDF